MSGWQPRQRREGTVLLPCRADEDAADPDWRLHACLESLQKLGIGALVTIGGDDTAGAAGRWGASFRRGGVDRLCTGQEHVCDTGRWFLAAEAL